MQAHRQNHSSMLQDQHLGLRKRSVVWMGNMLSDLMLFRSHEVSMAQHYLRHHSSLSSVGPRGFEPASQGRQ